MSSFELPDPRFPKPDAWNVREVVGHEYKDQRSAELLLGTYALPETIHIEVTERPTAEPVPVRQSNGPRHRAEPEVYWSKK